MAGTPRLRSNRTPSVAFIYCTVYSTPCVFYISVDLKRLCMTVKCAVQCTLHTLPLLGGQFCEIGNFRLLEKNCKNVCEFTTVVSMSSACMQIRVLCIDYIYLDKFSQISFTFWK